MPFTLLTQQDYANSLLNFAYSDPDVHQNLLPTDLTVGSLERAEVESLALVLEENDQRVAIAISDAISQACLNAFGFTLLPPSPATSSIVASCYVAPGVDIPIPTGWSILGNNGITYQTTEDGVLPAGELASSGISVVAQTPGTVGNAGLNIIITPVSPISGIDMVTNPVAAIGGLDQETLDQQAIRFSQFIQTLPRGSKDALAFAAYSASGAVVAAEAIEPFLLVPPPVGIPFAGIVWLFFDDGAGVQFGESNVPTPTDPVYLAIKQLVEGYTDSSGIRVPGYKAAGVHVTELLVTYAYVYVRGDIQLTPEGVGNWTNIQTELTAAANIYFAQLKIGDPVSYQNLVTALTDCDADILQVNLYIWLGNDGGINGSQGVNPPLYGSPMSADPIIFTGWNVGTRGVLYNLAGNGPIGSGVWVNPYPEWRLINA